MTPLSPAQAFLLVVAALFSPLPQDAVLLLVGASVAASPGGALPLTAAAWAGLLVKNSLLLALGWVVGGGLWEARWVRSRVPAARRAAIEGLLDRHGAAAIFVSRFLPGARAGALIVVGARRGALLRPWLAMAAGSGVQVLALCGLGGFAPPGWSGRVVGLQVAVALLIALVGGLAGRRHEARAGA